MVIPVSEESFNYVAESTKKLIELVDILKEDKKAISALNSIPNMDAVSDGEEAAPLFGAIIAQDVVCCLDTLFGEVNLTSKGAVGLYTYFSQLSGGETSYLTYMQLVLGVLEDNVSANISNIRNWGVNATTDEFKFAILLSKVDDMYLEEYWKLICQFGYYVVYAESKVLDEGISEQQQNYLNNIQLRARKYLEDSSLDFISSCEANLKSNKGELLPNIPFVSCKKEGELCTYTILKDKIIDYTIEAVKSQGTKTSELQAKILRRGGLGIKILYMFPKHYWGEYPIDGKKYVVKEETIFILKCEYTGENYSLKSIDYPLINIKAPLTGQLILPYFSASDIDDDISFSIKTNSGSTDICYDKFFNIYEYCRVSTDILKKIEPYSDSLYVELHWNNCNGSYVHKNDILGSIKIESLGIDKEFIALSDGYFFIAIKSFYDSINKWNFLCNDEEAFSQESLLYTIYADKETWIEENCGNFEIIEDKDIFNDQLNLKWNVVANRYIDAYKLQGYPVFEMTSNKGISIFVSFEYFDEKAYIVFGIKSTDIQLRIGDTFSLLLKNEEEKKVLDFSIVSRPTQMDCSDIKMYDKVYYFELFYEDIETLKSYTCTNWRITFADNRRIAIDGVNESEWTPSFLAGDVFRNFAISFDTELSDRDIEIERHRTAMKPENGSLPLENSCYVYLMHDTANDFYKIGISNTPEYRERTLQSEKPTIEMVCCKEYPIRSIAEAFEAALHKTFANKRIRGEWFSLDETDVMVLVKTLS